MAGENQAEPAAFPVLATPRPLAAQGVAVRDYAHYGTT